MKSKDKKAKAPEPQMETEGEAAHKPSFFKKNKKKLLLFFVGFAGVLGLGVAVFFLGTYLLREKPPEVKNYTLKEFSDTEIEFSEEEKDLMKSIVPNEYNYKIGEQSYQLKPQTGVRFARVTFVLSANKEKDLDEFEKNEAFIIETIIKEMLQLKGEDFEGPTNKEILRERFLTALKSRTGLPITQLRYSTIRLH